jgi:hypothetical protein
VKREYLPSRESARAKERERERDLEIGTKNNRDSKLSQGKISTVGREGRRRVPEQIET